MQKSNIISKFIRTYFDPSLDFRIQAFNLLAFTGMTAGIIAMFTSFITGMSINIIVSLFTSVFAFTLIQLSRKKNCYIFCYRLTVVIVFIIAFPLMFFMAGGNHSGMPCYYVFAIVFTALMLDGRDMVIAVSVEFIVYISACVFAYLRPDTVTFFETESDFLIDTLSAMITSSLLLIMLIILYIRIYNNRQKQLEGLGKLKTEFLQDISHEMQNPLTIITTGIDFISSCVSKPDGACEALKALKIVQNEAMRLGRMVGSMVKLVAMSGNTESREKVNFSVMLNNCAEMFRLILEKKLCTLRVDIPRNLPYVYGVADRLTQVLTNLLSNAVKYTHLNGQVTLEALYDSAFITVIVRNSGESIPPAILPHIFERGVSGKKSSGFGLPICKTIVEAHGGAINVESKPGKGAVVAFTLPVYGGQSEVRGYE